MSACPRCGAPWANEASCPSCGYEREHPGILGAYRLAVRSVVARPFLALPFLLPSLVLFGAQVATAAVDDANDSVSLAEGAVNVASGLLMLWWFFVVVGFSTKQVARESARFGSSGPIIAASGLAAAATMAPLALVTGILVWSPQGALGGLLLVAAVLLLMASILVAGRAVGVPVEAALAGSAPTAAARAGSSRARENGGLGLVFLAVLLLTILAVVPAVLDAVGLGLSERQLIGVGALASWPLGAWTGLAFVHGLAQLTHPTTRFTCPRCGAVAQARGGRARCSCGLEGPYHQG